MNVNRESNLKEYAQQFLQRQREKASEPALLNTDVHGDPVGWLANLYPYKLPQPFNDKIQVVSFETPNELNNLLIHEYMLRDNRMVERCLVPCPKTRRLGDMATIALERGCFENNRSDDTQLTLFRKWKDRKSLMVLSPANRILWWK